MKNISKAKSSIILLSVALIASLCFLSRAYSEIYGFKDSEFLKTDGYDLEFIKSEEDKNHWRIGYFKFRWKGENSIKLFGFGFEKNGIFRVRFEGYSRLTDGKWEEVGVGYCGTGSQLYELKPGTDYILKVSLSPYKDNGTQGVIKLEGDKLSIISKPFEVIKLKNDAGQMASPDAERR